MSLFNSIKITPARLTHINNYLPKEMSYDSIKISEIDKLGYYIRVYGNKKKKILKAKEEELLKVKEEKLFIKYRLYNVPLKGKSLGLVDVGVVRRFSSKSTGNSFENGLVQHAIEVSFEQSWAESNSQYFAVQQVKNTLKHKALELFPQSNAIENFNINFRELGSSGNVFLYASGTAIIADNIETIELIPEVENLMQEISELKDIIQDAEIKEKDFPSIKDLKKELKKLV